MSLESLQLAKINRRDSWPSLDFPLGISGFGFSSGKSWNMCWFLGVSVFLFVWSRVGFPRLEDRTKQGFN